MAYVYIAITSMLWSGMEVALKFVGGQFHPMQLTFSRVLAGGLFLLPLALRTLRRRGLRPDAAAWGTFVKLSLVGVTVSLCANQLAVVRIPAAMVSTLASTNPVFIVLLAYLILRDPIAKHQVVSLLLAILGILLVIRPWSLHLDPLGIACSLASTLTFSLYSVCGRRQSQRYGGVVVTCFCFLLGALEMILLSGLTHLPSVIRLLDLAGLGSFASIPFFSGYSLASLPGVLYIYVGGTGIGFACYFMSIEKGSAQQASVAFLVKPVLAPIIAYVVLHETIQFNELCGISAIVSAALILVLHDLLKPHSLGSAIQPQVKFKS